MTKQELQQKLRTAIAELCRLQIVLEYAVRESVPPDTLHVVQLNTVARLLYTTLAKLDTLELDEVQERR
jgi:hypothetical protein